MKKGDLKRGQILDTAERLFFERGYDRTSIQDILDELRLSKGGFYHYFDAKETVLREICERRWLKRFEGVRAELAARRGPVERLNLLLNMLNLFEAEDVHFAALMLKVCWRDGDAAINAFRRRILVGQLTPLVDEAVREGIESGVMHTRHPGSIGRLLVLLACDINDEACAMLAAEPDNPDRLISIIEMLNACRESVEVLAGAPFGSMTLFDPARLTASWQAAVAELENLEGRAL